MQKLNNQENLFCWGTGRPLEFLHVDDLASACLFALENWDINDDSAPKYNNGEKISFLNVGTGKDISIYDLSNLIASIVGYEGKILWDKSKPDGTPKKQLDTSRINKMGWYPKIDLRGGLIDTINKFKRQNNYIKS